VKRLVGRRNPLRTRKPGRLPHFPFTLGRLRSGCGGGLRGGGRKCVWPLYAPCFRPIPSLPWDRSCPRETAKLLKQSKPWFESGPIVPTFPLVAETKANGPWEANTCFLISVWHKSGSGYRVRSAGTGCRACGDSGLGEFGGAVNDLRVGHVPSVELHTSVELRMSSFTPPSAAMRERRARRPSGRCDRSARAWCARAGPGARQRRSDRRR